MNVNKRKIGSVFLIVFLLASLSCLTVASAQTEVLEWQSLVFYGFPSGNTVDYVYNETAVFPYRMGDSLVGGVVYINSEHSDYTIYGNITYANGTAFTGTYNVWSGYQSNTLSYALTWTDTLTDSGVVDDTLYYSGWGAVGDYNFWTTVPEMSFINNVSSYFGLKIDFLNATAGVNFSVIMLFVIDNFYGTFEAGGDATPTPTFDVTWGSGSAPTTWIGFAVYGVGLLLTFIGLVILMKAPAGWMPALFLIAVGLVVALSQWVSIYGLVGWALIVLISPVFLYSGSKGQTGVSK